MTGRPTARRASRSALRTMLALTATVSFAGALAGCADDGRALRAPPPGATAPPLPTSTTAAVGFNPPGGSQEPASTVALTSIAFSDGAAIPERYACTGENISPPLSWTGVPPGTAELAITVTDLDTRGDTGGDTSGDTGGPADGAAGGFVHWAVAGLSPELVALDEGAAPEGSVQARNDSSELGWFGPCPLEGATHRYEFRLYALSAPSDLAPGVSGAEVVAALATVPGVSAILTGTYTSTGA